MVSGEERDHCKEDSLQHVSAYVTAMGFLSKITVWQGTAESQSIS